MPPSIDEKSEPAPNVDYNPELVKTIATFKKNHVLPKVCAVANKKFEVYT